MTVASATDLPPLYPLAAAASTLLGRSAVLAPHGPTLLLGLFVYAGVSMGLSLTYHLPKTSRLLSSLFTVRGRLRPAVSGILFGLLVWLALLLASKIYPWFSQTPLLFSFWMLAGFFGLPLGLLAAKTERGQPVELKIVYSSSSLAP